VPLNDDEETALLGLKILKEQADSGSPVAREFLKIIAERARRYGSTAAACQAPMRATLRRYDCLVSRRIE
jgi:hypothetical protein